jgi:hypothetical protein
LSPRNRLGSVGGAWLAARAAYKTTTKHPKAAPHPLRAARRLAARPREAATRVAQTMRAHENGAAVVDERPPLRAVSTVPDVLLDVPSLKVEEIDLEHDDLQARVSLATQLLDLLKLDVGADARLGKVELKIKGLEARAQLQVRLDNVERIVERTMTTLDRNPKLVENLAEGIETALDQVGNGAAQVAGELAQDVGAVSRTLTGADERKHAARPRATVTERRPRE